MKSLAIWILWLLASLAVGALAGAWLLHGEIAIPLGAIAGGFAYSCLVLWRNW
jgi:hypothetical protein